MDYPVASAIVIPQQSASHRVIIRDAGPHTFPVEVGRTGRGQTGERLVHKTGVFFSPPSFRDVLARRVRPALLLAGFGSNSLATMYTYDIQNAFTQ